MNRSPKQYKFIINKYKYDNQHSIVTTALLYLTMQYGYITVGNSLTAIGQYSFKSIKVDTGHITRALGPNEICFSFVVL